MEQISYRSGPYSFQIAASSTQIAHVRYLLKPLKLNIVAGNSTCSYDVSVCSRSHGSATNLMH